LQHVPSPVELARDIEEDFLGFSEADTVGYVQRQIKFDFPYKLILSKFCVCHLLYIGVLMLVELILDFILRRVRE
jgi:hypothetical protein